MLWLVEVKLESDLCELNKLHLLRSEDDTRLLRTDANSTLCLLCASDDDEVYFDSDSHEVFFVCFSNRAGTFWFLVSVSVLGYFGCRTRWHLHWSGHRLNNKILNNYFIYKSEVYYKNIQYQ